MTENDYPIRLQQLTIRYESVPDVLVMFGDESRTDDLVTYGIVATNGEQHHLDAKAAWNRVIEAAGGVEDARVHARELFSGDARARSAWRHLGESEVERLTLDLMSALVTAGARFFIGVVYKKTYPVEGVPAGLNAKGEQTYVPLTDEIAYAFGFAAATAAMRTGDHAPLRSGVDYRLYIDPQRSKAPLWGHGNLQIRRLIEGTGLVPTKYDQKPLLLDAADLLAYAGARALSDHDARNKAVCREIYGLCSPQRGHFWWNPQDGVIPEMKYRLGLE